MLAIEEVNRGGVSSDNRVLEFHTAGLIRTSAVVINPSPVIREADGNNVGSNGAMGQSQATEEVKDTAAVRRTVAACGAFTTNQGVAAHGAAVHINGAAPVVEDAAADTRTAT